MRSGRGRSGTARRVATAAAAVLLGAFAVGVLVDWVRPKPTHEASRDPAASATPTATPTPSGPSLAPLPQVTATLRPLPTPTPTRTASSAPAVQTLAGWPGPDNTGWQHTGVRLTPIGCTAGGELRLDKPGTVITGRDIPCSVYVTASNVTILRSRISSGADWAVRTDDSVTGFRIEDTEIAGQPGCQAALTFAHWTAYRLNIHGCGDGVRAEEQTLLQDTWIHDFWNGYKNGQQIDTPHHDGVQDTGGSGLTIRHNRIDNPHDQTSCILIGGEFGSPSDILIENNYLDGGNFTIYLDPKGSNRRIVDNTFTRNHVYGTSRLDGQYTWTGNHYTDGAAVVP
ncbi:MAG: right-handed parallel beta-helix repeat-containing protein [Actinobacteria bacterium]|nr:right-handed parallel beta-helix repeat-containing protein [Actinomycetota bacterium]MBI3686597.1 right-handed parallel beta-helix repeat-containing protein [Actinomycetota bacterium]